MTDVYCRRCEGYISSHYEPLKEKAWDLHCSTDDCFDYLLQRIKDLEEQASGATGATRGRGKGQE
jgi:hypothetical protein